MVTRVGCAMEGLSVKIAKMRYPIANGSGDLIEDVSFDVAPRERVAFIGRSGAGKTTLLRIVAGLERCFQGSVMLDGQALDGPVRSVQLLFQDNRLLPWKTAFENVAFATDDPKGVTNAEQVMLALGRVGLQDRADAWPKNLSGGEAARVAIARALIASPRLLLLDEPFQNLDSITRLEVERQLLAALETVKPMMLLVSHDVQDAVL